MGKKQPDLHPHVVSLIQQKAYYRHVNNVAHQHHPYIDHNKLMCYAVHYGHEEYVKRQKLRFHSLYCPMLTAVYKKDKNMMVTLGWKYRQWVRRLDIDQFFGKFEDNEIVYKEMVSVYDAVFQVDDLDIYRRILFFLYDDGIGINFYPHTMARRTEYHGARKCFEITARYVGRDFQPDSDQPANHQPDSDQPANHQPDSHQPANHQPDSHQPANHQPDSDQPANHQPANHKPANHQPDSHQPANHQPANHQPASNQPANHQPASNQPASNQPSGGSSSVVNGTEQEPHEPPPDTKYYKEIIERVCSVSGRVTPMLYEEVLHYYVHKYKFLGFHQYFVARPEWLFLKKLTQRNSIELTRYCQNAYDNASNLLDVEGMGLFSCISTLDIHSRLIFQLWTDCTKYVDPDLCDYNPQEILTRTVFSVMDTGLSDIDQYSTRFVRTLYLLNAMTSYWISFNPNPSRVYFPSSYLWRIEYDPTPKALPVYQLYVKHLMLLLAAYHQVLDFDVYGRDLNLLEVDRESHYARGVARVVLSMLPHEKYEQYRLSIPSRQQLYLEEKQIRDCPDDELENQWPETVLEVSSPRSLKELCRLRLRELIPDLHKYAHAPQRLDIGPELVAYLTLHTKWYSMDWGAYTIAALDFCRTNDNLEDYLHWMSWLGDNVFDL